jgi:hypothetical protein
MDVMTDPSKGRTKTPSIYRNAHQYKLLSRGMGLLVSLLREGVSQQDVTVGSATSPSFAGSAQDTFRRLNSLERAATTAL